MALQSDGKILMGGRFTTLVGQPRTNIGQVNADGTLDSVFNPPTDGYSVQSVAVQADGKILAGGLFTMLGGEWRTNLARLNSDGSVDPDFNPGTGPMGVSYPTVLSLALQTDGRILAGGSFTTLGGKPRSYIG